jgi:hypothetical protein
MKKIGKKNKIKLGKASATITIGLVIGISLMIMNYSINIDENTIEIVQRSWTAIADADPGAGNYGFLRVGTCAHEGTPDTAYATNVSSWYEYTDSLGSAEMTGETPSDTAFDFVLRFRTNATVNWASGNSTWVEEWVRAQIKIDFELATDNTVFAGNMNIVETGNNSQYAWYQAYIQDVDGGSGAGFTISNDEDFTIDWVSADGYF